MASIYDSVLDPDNWTSILDRIGDRTGARVLNLVVGDFYQPEVDFGAMSSVITPELLQEFQEQCAEIETPVVLRMREFKSREFVTDSELLAGRCTYDEFPTFGWLEARAGIRRRTSVRLSNNASWLDVLTFNYCCDRGQMSNAEREIAALFLPHFAKAVELTRPFQMLRIRFRAVLSALDRLHIGVLVVRDDCAVILKNCEAQRILEGEDGLTTDARGLLRAVSGQDRTKLTAAISASTATSVGEGTEAGSMLSMSRSNIIEPLLLEVSPIRDRELETMGTGSALIFVIDPRNRAYVTTCGMRELFNLTAAEAEVCRLMADGFDTRGIAEHRNVEPATVRSQIKQVFQKTGVARQAELVRLALSINLPIDRA